MSAATPRHLSIRLAMSCTSSKPSGHASIIDPTGRGSIEGDEGLSWREEPRPSTRKRLRRAGVASGGRANLNRGIFLATPQERRR